MRGEVMRIVRGDGQTPCAGVDEATVIGFDVARHANAQGASAGPAARQPV